MLICRPRPGGRNDPYRGSGVGPSASPWAAPMIARILIVAIALTAVVAGGAMYYFQVYGFYERVAAGEVRLTPLDGNAPQVIDISGFSAIDSTSAPVRYRACFQAAEGLAALVEAYAPHPAPEPLTGPSWFDCYDARAVGAALETGAMVAFMGQEDIRYGIDRVVAVDDAGRGVVWHQINRCGAAVFGGDQPPDGCAPPPEES